MAANKTRQTLTLRDSRVLSYIEQKRGSILSRRGRDLRQVGIGPSPPAEPSSNDLVVGKVFKHAEQTGMVLPSPSFPPHRQEQLIHDRR